MLSMGEQSILQTFWHLTDDEHTRLANFWVLASSSTGIPDFLVFDNAVRRYGWAGVKAAGFFGPDWQLDPVSSYLPE